MKLTEYAAYDALGLGDLVNRGEVTPRELAATAMEAIEAVDPTIKAVVETYPDRIENLDESSLGTGPFRGVPFLIKDIFGHEAGRKIEFGSRLCRGMCIRQGVVVDTFPDFALWRQLDPFGKCGGVLRRLHCLCLELDGACECQCRVPTFWIIEPVDVFGYGGFSVAS